MTIDQLIALLAKSKTLEGVDGNTPVLETNWYYDMTDGYKEVDPSNEVQVIKDSKKRVEGVYIFG